MNIVVWDDLPEGGAKRVVVEQIRGLSKTCRVDYVTNEVVSRLDYGSDVSSVHRFNMGLKEYRGLLRPMQELSFVTKVLPVYRRIIGLITSLNPDVVLIHPSMLSQAPFLLTMIRFPSVYYAEEWPRVVYEPEFHPLPAGFHGMYEVARRQAIKRIDHASARSASAVVTSSRYLQNKLSKIYDRKISVIAPGVDLSTFCPNYSEKRSGGYFLFFGEAEKISGYPLLKKAIDQDFPVNIVNFKSGGFRYSDEEVADLYRGATATLCLSENEPFGLTAIESMACGTPVIAVDSGGYRDTVTHGETGMLIDPDIDQLLPAMKLLRESSVLRKRMGEAGRARVETHYRWEQHVAKLKKVLDSIR
jgi:glycosyltransferase involved in cell wall biosynthesis